MAVLTKKQIESRVIEWLRRKPAIFYPELLNRVLPAPIEMDNHSKPWFDELLGELKAKGVISWQSGEIRLLQAESAAFGGAPENAMSRRGVFKKRRKRA